jgi:1-acyl-sn-glycerol-3-phosphate acyltransferase
MAAAVGLLVCAPLWLPVVAIVDIARLQLRFPRTRLTLFGLLWAWIESAGLARSFVAWATGRATDQNYQYALMAWWCDALMRALRATTGIRLAIAGDDALQNGNAVVLSRHASLADSLVTAWVFLHHAGLRPRYVLKRELLSDPCLDVVGLRVPTYFVDRGAADGDAELERVAALSANMGPDTVSVIFPEGTRASSAKRHRALEIISERDPERAARLTGLQHVLPPRPAGSRALLSGAPDADVILIRHTGFDGLHHFKGMVRKLAKPIRPASVVAQRVPRHEVPSGPAFDSWLDEAWIEMDRQLATELAEHG